MKKALIPLALVVVVAVYFLSTKVATSEPTEPHSHEHSHQLRLTDEQRKEAGIEVKEAAHVTLHPLLKKTGKLSLHPDRIVHVLANVHARASKGYKNVGDPVKKGEPLARLLSPEMGEKKNNFLSALRKQTKTEEAFKRSEELFSKQIISLDDYKSLEADHLDAVATLELSKQELAAFGLSLDEIHEIGKGSSEELQKVMIRSPIDGVVLERHMTVGENIDTTSPIYVLADLSKLWVEIPLFPSEFELVHRGSPIKLQGQITKLLSLSPQVGQESYLAKGIAEIDNSDGRFLPGAIVSVEIELGTVAASIAIEKEAIQTLEGKPHVFIVTEEGFTPREVTLGAEDDAYIEIVAGLDVGEHYTSKHAFILKADLGKEAIEHDD